MSVYRNGKLLKRSEPFSGFRRFLVVNVHSVMMTRSRRPSTFGRAHRPTNRHIRNCLKTQDLVTSGKAHRSLIGTEFALSISAAQRP
ncbi:hypothetical protein OSTOST_12714 [Ostertagia ostertagi]